MMVMAVEMMMMIPMKSGVMTMTMAMIPPSGKEFPRQISPCRRAFSLSVVSASWRRRNIFSRTLCVLGFLGDEAREGGAPEVGQGHHTWLGRGQGGPRAQGWCGPLLAHLSLPFWLSPSSDKIGTSVFSEIFLVLQKYSDLTLLFPAEI